MPFGLKVSPTIFQRAVEKALRHLLDAENVQAYLDDIVIFTKSIAEHLRVLRKVLEALKNRGFFINWPKSQMLQERALYLGHIVSHNKLEPDPAKVDALAKTCRPMSKVEVLSFVAAASFLRSYIPRFSEVAEPLTRLTAKRVKFE